MADVFLSYASEDLARVQPLVRPLEEAGFSVWWDRRIEPGTSFDRTIERELEEAAVVIVIWSDGGVESDWVREEAEEGLRRGVLIPVQIDECRIPLGFRRTQALQLVGWPKSRPDLTPLIERVGTLIGNGAGVTTRPPHHRWCIGLSVGGLVVMIALAAGYHFREDLTVALLLNAPSLFFGKPVEQDLAIATSADGTRIAYATSGAGPPIVQVLSFWSHLENGTSSPIYDTEGLLAMTSRAHLLVRYDGRGCGLSDRDVDDYSLAARVTDLEAVVDGLGLERVGILGVSAGGPTAIAYTAKHPGRVTRLVVAGAQGSNAWMTDQQRAWWRRTTDLFEVGWARPEVVNIQAQLVLAPADDPVARRFVSEMLMRSASGDAVAKYLRATLEIDVREQAREIRVPTLVLQASDDAIVPVEAGREIASLIPEAKFELITGGHLASTASTAATRRRALRFLDTGE